MKCYDAYIWMHVHVDTTESIFDAVICRILMIKHDDDDNDDDDENKCYRKHGVV